MPFEITSGEPEKRDILLREFVRGLTEMSNMFLDGIGHEAVADTLISGGVEALRKRYGVEVAAERLRAAADAVERANPETEQ